MMKKIVKFPVELTEKKYFKYLYEHEDVHTQMLKGASIECFYKGEKVVLEKQNRNKLDSRFATKTTIKRKKLKVITDKPTAYMFHQYAGYVIPLWEVEEE